MHRGWFRVWRKVEDSIVWKDPDLWRVWSYCLMKANHREKLVKVDGLAMPVTVRRGQFLTGRYALHEGVFPRRKKSTPSASTTWRLLLVLKKLGNLDIQTTSRYTLVTLCNYETYNPLETEDEQEFGQPVDSRWTAGEQPVNTTKNEKNDKKGKKKDKAPAGAGDVSVTTQPPPTELLALIDGWNRLGPTIVRPGNGANRSPPSKAALRGWARVQREPEQRQAFQDLGQVFAAIQRARFCHRKGWFTLPWLFATNHAGEFNITKLLNGAHEGEESTQTRSGKPLGSRSIARDIGWHPDEPGSLPLGDSEGSQASQPGGDPETD